MTQLPSWLVCLRGAGRRLSFPHWLDGLSGRGLQKHHSRRPWASPVHPLTLWRRPACVWWRHRQSCDCPSPCSSFPIPQMQTVTRDVTSLWGHLVVSRQERTQPRHTGQGLVLEAEGTQGSQNPKPFWTVLLTFAGEALEAFLFGFVCVRFAYNDHPWRLHVCVCVGVTGGITWGWMVVWCADPFYRLTGEKPEDQRQEKEPTLGKLLSREQASLSVSLPFYPPDPSALTAILSSVRAAWIPPLSTTIWGHGLVYLESCFPVLPLFQTQQPRSPLWLGFCQVSLLPLHDPIPKLPKRPAIQVPLHLPDFRFFIGLTLGFILMIFLLGCCLIFYRLSYLLLST